MAGERISDTKYVPGAEPEAINDAGAGAGTGFQATREEKLLEEQQSQQEGRGEAEGTGERWESVKDQAQDAGHQVKEKAERQARQYGSKARKRGFRYVERRREWLADEVSRVGHAVREASRKLHEEDERILSGYADAAAEQVETFGQYLNESDTREIANDLEKFARQHPGLVAGALFATGMGLARFLKAGSESRRSKSRGQPRRQDNFGYDYDQGSYRGYDARDEGQFGQGYDQEIPRENEFAFDDSDRGY